MEELKTARKAISKKIRFEVFKRDGFRCQYCGNVPPAVTLEPDHVDPVANGGTNDIDNLITACFDCNRGKADRLLSSIPKTINEKAEILAEREEQLMAYQEIIRKKQSRIEQEVERVSEIYSTFVPDYQLTEISKVSIRKFIERLGVSEVEEAMTSACQKLIWTDSRIFKYFCGICWNKIRRMEEVSG